MFFNVDMWKGLGSKPIVQTSPEFILKMSRNRVPKLRLANHSISHVQRPISPIQVHTCTSKHSPVQISKVLSEYVHDRWNGRFEQVRLVQFADLDALVRAHIQVDVITAANSQVFFRKIKYKTINTRFTTKQID